MNIVLSYALNSLLTFVEVFAIYQLASCFFSAKCRGWRFSTRFLALVIIHISILIIAQGNFLLKLALFILADLLWMRWVFCTQIMKCLVVSVLFSSFMVVGDSIILAGFSTLFLHDLQAYMKNPYAYYTFCFAVKIAELLIIITLKLLTRGRMSFQSITWRDWTRVLMFPLASFVIVISLLKIYASSQEVSPQVLSCCVILVCVDLLTIILLNYLDQQQKALHDYAILKHSIRLEQDNLTAWMNAYSHQRRQTHEYHNQLEVIRGLAQHDESNDQLIQYVSNLLQTDTSQLLFVNTGRTVIDVILNQKNAIAQNKGVTINANLDDLKEFALPDDALVVILSNLIDNAITACEKIPDPAKRVIRLNMHIEPSGCFLYIENPTIHPVKIVDNKVLISTKKNPQEHGYGLKNIVTLLNQYNADYVLDYQEDTQLFCFSVQILPQNNSVTGTIL